jgi:hypothetical protein
MGEAEKRPIRFSLVEESEEDQRALYKTLVEECDFIGGTAVLDDVGSLVEVFFNEDYVFAYLRDKEGPNGARLISGTITGEAQDEMVSFLGLEKYVISAG